MLVMAEEAEAIVCVYGKEKTTVCVIRDNTGLRSDEKMLKIAMCTYTGMYVGPCFH